MGLMMLWMLHQQMTSPTTLSGAALATFVGAHLLIVAAVICGAFFASRLHPRLQSLIAGLHRPSWHHMRGMGIGMIMTAGVAHLILHGGL